MKVLPWRTAKGGIRPGVTADPRKDENWCFPTVEMTALEERITVATMVQIGVIVCMNTHLYSFDGRTFLQQAGGPNGLRATCAIARVVMNTWDTRYMEKMAQNNIKVKDGSRYMVDIRIFLMAIQEGWRLFEGALCYCEAWRQEDAEAGKTATRRTAEILLHIMNSVISFLKFTLEIGEDFEDRILPTLDLKIWVQDGKIEFMFFVKPMATNTGLHAKTALSNST